MTTRIRGTLFVAGLALVALLATACGGGGAATHFSLRTKNSQPAGITTGPDGNLWFTEFTSGRIARISTAGKMDEYPLPTDRAGPSPGPAGRLSSRPGSVAEPGAARALAGARRRVGLHPVGTFLPPDENVRLRIEQRRGCLSRIIAEAHESEPPPEAQRLAEGDRHARHER